MTMRGVIAEVDRVYVDNEGDFYYVVYMGDRYATFSGMHIMMNGEYVNHEEMFSISKKRKITETFFEFHLHMLDI